MDKMTMEEKHLRAVIYPTAKESERILILHIERTCSTVLKEIFDKIKEAQESYKDYLKLDYKLDYHIILYLEYKGYKTRSHQDVTEAGYSSFTTIKF